VSPAKKQKITKKAACQWKLLVGDESPVVPNVNGTTLSRAKQQSTGNGALPGTAVPKAGLTRGVNGAATHHTTEKLDQPRILCRRTLLIGSHNICGAQGRKELDGETRDLGKIEQLAIHMKRGDPKAPRVEMLQETWLLGDWIRRIHDVLVIHHGPRAKPNKRGSGGVAILLNPAAAKAWTHAGHHEPYRPGPADPAADPNCRIIGITLRFQDPKHKHKSEAFFICNAYAPDSGAVKNAQKKKTGSTDPQPNDSSASASADTYQLTLDQITAGYAASQNEFGNDTPLILGGDFNASIGTRRDTIDPAVLGPFGIAHNNSLGDTLLDYAATQGLRFAASFHQSRLKVNPYATFADKLHNNRPLQLDHFLTTQTLGSRIHQCCSYRPTAAIESDHHPVQLQLCLEKMVVSREKVCQDRARAEKRRRQTHSLTFDNSIKTQKRAPTFALTLMAIFSQSILSRLIPLC